MDIPSFSIEIQNYRPTLRIETAESSFEWNQRFITQMLIIPSHRKKTITSPFDQLSALRINRVFLVRRSIYKKNSSSVSRSWTKPNSRTKEDGYILIRSISSFGSTSSLF